MLGWVLPSVLEEEIGVVLYDVCGELRVFSFSFLNSFLTPAFLWTQRNLSWKGSLDAIWSKLCSNQVTETRTAYAVFVALGLTKAGSSGGGVLCLPWVSNTSSHSRFCYSPGVMGWHMTAGERPSCSLPSSYSAGQAALKKAACFAAGVCGDGSVRVKDMYHVRETVISSWWMLFLSPSYHCHFL